MGLEIYRALIKANVPPEDAQAVADSLRKEIDRNFDARGSHVATKADIADVRKGIAEAKAEIIKWCMGSVFAAVGIFAALSKLLH